MGKNKIFVCRKTMNGGSYLLDEDDETNVKYFENKSIETDKSLANSKKYGGGTSMTDTAGKNTHYTDTKTYGGNNKQGPHYGGYGHGSTTYSTYNMKPTKVFEFSGVEYWGSAKTNLDSVDFREGDIIINATGMEWTPPPPPAPPKPFIKSAPEWLKTLLSIPPIDNTKPESKKYFIPEQIVLDWQDMSPPPGHISISFWYDLLNQIVTRNVKRVFMCCTAGQGRTGTMIASFILANGITKDAAVAVAFIRKVYTSNAVETEGQVKYLKLLASKIVDDDELDSEDYSEQEDETNKNNTHDYSY